MYVYIYVRMMGFDLQAMLANDDFRRWIDDGSVQEHIYIYIYI